MSHNHTRNSPSLEVPGLDACNSLFESDLRSSMDGLEPVELDYASGELLEASPAAVLLVDHRGHVEISNQTATQITGRSSDQLRDGTLFDWIVDPDNLPWKEWCALSPGVTGFSTNIWVSRSSGERRWVSIQPRCVELPELGNSIDSTERLLQLAITDITESTRRIAELELLNDLTTMVTDERPLEDVYELVSSRLHDFLNYRLVTIGEFDDQLSEVFAYRNYLTELTIPLVFDVQVGLCGLAIRENRSVLAANVSDWDEYLEIDEDVQSEAIALIRFHDRPVGLIDIQSDSTQPLGPQDLKLIESIAAHLGFLMERIEINQQLRQQATTDPLTGAGNRRALVRDLISRTGKLEPELFALLFVELDHFKTVNDRLGHLFGDEMLKQVTTRLKQSLRDDGAVYRYGGDELAIVLPGMGRGDAHDVAEQLRYIVASSAFSHDGQSATLTVSIGVALCPEHGRTTDDILGAADRAMYAAKRTGRNSVHSEP
jgi:diguanylate cyclase (GGDEF)-like protein/PAS domain S-box-containing protein